MENTAGIRININVERTGTEMILTRDCGDTFTIKDTRRNEELIDFFIGTDESVTPQQITEGMIEKMAEEKYEPLIQEMYDESNDGNIDVDVREFERTAFIEGAKAIRDLINKQ